MKLIEELKEQGYKMILIPKRSRTKFYATKEEYPLKDDANIDEYIAETDEEKAALKVLPRNTWINLMK